MKPGPASSTPAPALASALAPHTIESTLPWISGLIEGSMLTLSSVLPETNPRFQPMPSRKSAIVNAVVADGGALLAPSVTRRLISRFAVPPSLDSSMVRRLDRLTDREREVLVAVAAGLSNIEIAEQLFVGAATIKSHVSSILTKLGLTNRAQVVAFAYESGLVKPGDSDIGF